MSALRAAATKPQSPDPGGFSMVLVGGGKRLRQLACRSAQFGL